MPRILTAVFTLLIALSWSVTLPAQGEPASVSQALAQGSAYLKAKDYQNALNAFQDGDKLARHSSANCYLGMFDANRGLGNFPDALDDAKGAIKAAGSDKARLAAAHLDRATLLMQMATKPGDKKLREAEYDAREVLELVPEASVGHLILGKILVRQQREEANPQRGGRSADNFFSSDILRLDYP